MFVPPCPGDEGIAVGCAAFGWHNRHHLLPTSVEIPRTTESEKAVAAATNREIPSVDGGRTEGEDVWGVHADVDGEVAERRPQQKRGEGILAPEELPLPVPFWGKDWTVEDVEDELGEWEPWLDVRPLQGFEVSCGKVLRGCCFSREIFDH